MSMILQPEEVCPYRKNCKYNDKSKEWYCRGIKTRNEIFICDLIKENIINDKKIDKEKINTIRK